MSDRILRDHDFDARISDLEQRCIKLDGRIDKVFAQANSTKGSLKQLRNVVSLLIDGSNSEVIVDAFPDWRAIEGAPKDGRSVLVYVDGLITPASYINGAWTDDHWDDGIRPTHWMPLPEPPTVEKNASA